MVNKRCIALYSGGLDSILIAKIMQKQSIDAIALHFCTPFFGYAALRQPDQFRQYHKDKYGIDVRPVDFTEDLTRIINNPKHGFGKHLNPCIDCKIGMLRKAGSLLEELDASFIVTGEVLGQRPMSQRRDAMNAITKDAGLRDIIIRPLSAKLFPPTLPEREGIVNRELLYDITGRGRKDQLELAAEYGIDPGDIPTPAGGCLLTYEQIANKVGQTFERFRPELPQPADLLLDTVGRKFILDEETVLVVSRDEKENDALAVMQYPGNIFLKIQEVPGPLCIFRGNPSEKNLMNAAAICFRYCKERGKSGYMAVYGPDPSDMTESICAPVVTDEYCKSLQLT